MIHHPNSKPLSWRELDSWLESHGWCLVNCGIYTQEDYSDSYPYYGIELDEDPETGAFLVSFGKFLEVMNQLKSPFIEFHTMEQFVAIAENLRLVISLLKLAESGRPQMSVIEGGLKGVADGGEFDDGGW